MSDRPPIPAADKRYIRQRCHFGCVVCGLPLYEYDHLDGYANVQVHDRERIVLLCDRHHRERGSGLLPTAQVEAALRRPHNAGAGASSPYALHFSGRDIRVTLGNNTVIQTQLELDRPYPVLMIQGRNVISFTISDQQLLLSMDMVDEKGNAVLTIADNELVHTATAWDVEFVGRTLTIRDAPRSVVLSMTLEPPNGLTIDNARFPTTRGVCEVSKMGVSIAGRMRLSACVSRDNHHGGFAL